MDQLGAELVLRTVADEDVLSQLASIVAKNFSTSARVLVTNS